ncbi:MAG: CPBP family intramembrane metalloprotease [Methylococcales bacterium]|nr:CPBP family intramembrane metalloprotease [Methylococcales bacterium]
MPKSFLKDHSFLNSACFFEATLIPLAIFLGWIVSINPFANIFFTETALVNGVIGTIPLILIFLALEQIHAKSVGNIRRLLLDTLGPGLQHSQWTDLLILALIAGIAEELLFRGVIQPWIEQFWGVTAGLVISNCIFGLVHAVTPLYALLAGLVGIYLGLSLNYGTEKNLLVPIIIHGLYDFLAFFALIRMYRKSL